MVFVVTVAIVICSSGAVVQWLVPPAHAPSAPAARTRNREAADRAAAEHAAGVEADQWWRNAEARAHDALAAGNWFQALAQITDPSGASYARFARATRVGPIEDAILAAAAKEESLDGGLTQVFFRAQQIRFDTKSSPALRAWADQAIAWASARALVPYGADLRALSAAYREVRFGDGRLDAVPTSLVRRFLFAEAAAELLRTRSALDTWMYEQRLLRKCAGLRLRGAEWTAFVREFAAIVARDPGPPVRGLLDPPGRRVFLDTRIAPDERGFTLAVEGEDASASRQFRWWDPAPARVAEAVVLPRLAMLEPATVLGLARIYAELGETSIAAECLRNAEARLQRRVPEVQAELDALEELAAIAGREVPDDVRASPEIEAWAEHHAGTDAVLATGKFLTRDIGAFGDDAINAYFSDGILWAPAQWDLVRERFAKAVPTKFDGLSGFQVESDHFTVFTDVSASFAAQATLVLDAAYEQAADVLGLVPAPHQRAVVYAHHADYLARFPNRSGGCWVPSDGAIYCFLDDPTHTRFYRFRYPILVHEAAHAALGTGVRNDPPSWMHEGVACYFERWNPSRSIRANAAATGTSLLRTWALRATHGAALPALPSLLGIREGWDVDEFGPITFQRYAMAEALFVHLMIDPVRRRFVTRFIDAVNAGVDPSSTLTPVELAALSESWRKFIVDADREFQEQRKSR